MDYLGQVCPAIALFFHSLACPGVGGEATFPPSLSRLTSKVGLYIQATLAL